MKTLYLVRHAKSSWEFDLTDHQRPLNDRGLNDAPMMAKHIAGTMDAPERFMSSDAVRALTTATFFAKAFEVPSQDIVQNHALYDFEGRQLANEIKEMDNTIDRLIVFGHNNAMTHFVNTYGDKKIDNVSTCGFTEIQFDIDDWKDLKPGETIRYIKPKHLK